MLYRSNQGRYGHMAEELQNDFTKGNVKCPENTTEEYNLIVNYKTSWKPPPSLVDDSEEVSFSNVGGSEGNYNSYKSGRGGG